MSTAKSELLTEEIDESSLTELDLKICPICKSTTFKPKFISHGFQVQSCQTCHLQLLNPQPSDQVLKANYYANFFVKESTLEANRITSELNRSSVTFYLDMLEKYNGSLGNRLLVV